MEFSLQAAILFNDGVVGQITHVIFNRKSQNPFCIVGHNYSTDDAAEDVFSFAGGQVVNQKNLKDIARKPTPKSIILNCATHDIFPINHVSSVTEAKINKSPFVAQPFDVPLVKRWNNLVLLSIDQRQPVDDYATLLNDPSEEWIVVKAGAPIAATDGGIGTVDRLILDDTDYHVTHLVVRTDNVSLYALPVVLIDRMNDEMIVLQGTKADVEAQAIAVPTMSEKQVFIDPLESTDSIKQLL